MGIEDSFIWYQKKIGTYDKQQWETTIDQKFMNGFDHISMRNTKPNTNLIDLDLVRGSSFTKAKPQHGLVTVIKQATLRCVLLPFYAKWWIRQTSKTEFCIFLFLYLLLWINITIYFVQGNSSKDLDMSKVLPYTEILIPFTMTWVLTLIFSQIVSTKPLIEQPKNGNLKPKLKKQQSSQFRRRRNVIRKSNSKVSFADLTTTTATETPPVTVTVTKVDDETPAPPAGTCRDDLVENIPAESTPVEDDEKSVDKSNREATVSSKRRRSSLLLTVRRQQRNLNGDDDGFESFCGNGSRTSEEDAPKSPHCSGCKKCDNYMRYVRGAKIYSELSNSGSWAFSSECSDSESEHEIRRLPSALRKTNCSQIESTEDDELFTEHVDWMGVTTNSDDCSYSSDMDDVQSTRFKSSYECSYNPAAILNPPSAKVSCTIWEGCEIKKADLSMLEISSAIIARVESMPESMDYFYVGVCLSIVLAFLPILHRSAKDVANSFDILTIFELNMQSFATAFSAILNDCYGNTFWERMFRIIASVQRCTLATFYFFLLSVAERTFKQRFLYSKLFSHLTSFRKAQKSKLPHFRLNKVRNIKTWLSVRAYLRRRGPQRSVDVIVSTAFILMVLLMSFLCIELLKENLSLNTLSNVEALVWCFGLGIMLLRFLTLGTKINKKYRNLSVLLTEQINLHLQIEQKPHKKDELTVANNVLKLAIDLLKELESPFKIVGFSANPIVSNIMKVVILSALSGVLSDMLGFKLKLHKIKIK